MIEGKRNEGRNKRKIMFLVIMIGYDKSGSSFLSVFLGDPFSSR